MNPRRLERLGQLRASAATRGAPTIMPIAKADVSTPAVPTVTSNSEAMSGKRPASMNSEVPMAKTAMASRYRGKGIEWLRGEERHEKVISSPRPAPRTNALVPPQNAARRQGYELSGSG